MKFTKCTPKWGTWGTNSSCTPKWGTCGVQRARQKTMSIIKMVSVARDNTHNSRSTSMTSFREDGWGGIQPPPNPSPIKNQKSSNPIENWYQYVKMNEEIENQGPEIQKLREVTTPMPHPPKFQYRWIETKIGTYTKIERGIRK